MKALREIDDLERRAKEGEKLRKNQLQKIEKKDDYSRQLQMLSCEEHERTTV
jgi:uncharacterized protein with WD repeat